MVWWGGGGGGDTRTVKAKHSRYDPDFPDDEEKMEWPLPGGSTFLWVFLMMDMVAAECCHTRQGRGLGMVVVVVVLVVCVVLMVMVVAAVEDIDMQAQSQCGCNIGHGG